MPEALIQLLITAINNAASISSLIEKARAENRDITPQEEADVIMGYTQAHDAAIAAVEAAKAAGF